MLDQPRPEEIAHYLHLETSPAPADLAFVFGGRSQAVAHLAADAWQARLVPRVLVTGGENRNNGINEARALKETLLERGVPEEAILVEDRSRNTWENVELALPLLERLPEAPRTILAITRWYHSRRAVMVLRRYLPGGTRYLVATSDCPRAPRQAWQQSEEGWKRVQKEWDHIRRYEPTGQLGSIRFDGAAYL